jgi:hypothetical protein
MSRKEIVTRNREYMSSGYFREWMPSFFRARIGWELEYGAIGRGFVFILPKNQDCEWPYQTVRDALRATPRVSLYFSGIDKNRDFRLPNIPIFFSLFIVCQRYIVALPLKSVKQDIKKLLEGGEIYRE